MGAVLHVNFLMVTCWLCQLGARNPTGERQELPLKVNWVVVRSVPSWRIVFKETHSADVARHQDEEPSSQPGAKDRPQEENIKKNLGDDAIEKNDDSEENDEDDKDGVKVDVGDWELPHPNTDDVKENAERPWFLDHPRIF